MRRQALLKQIGRVAKASGTDWSFVREGANHELWSFGDLLVPVPRHREIAEVLARKILADIEEEAHK